MSATQTLATTAATTDDTVAALAVGLVVLGVCLCAIAVALAFYHYCGGRQWWIRREEAGVPEAAPAPKLSLDSRLKSHFHPDLTREQAEMLLSDAPYASFVLCLRSRPTTTKANDGIIELIVSFVGTDGVVHGLVECDAATGACSIKSGRAFGSLIELLQDVGLLIVVEHNRQHKLPPGLEPALERFYHGEIASRQQAESLLRNSEPGSFVIRKRSSAKAAVEYSIAFVGAQRIDHFIVTYDRASARYTASVDGSLKEFASLVEILQRAGLNLDQDVLDAAEGKRSKGKKSDKKSSSHYANCAAEFMFADAASNKHSRHYEVLTAAEAGYDIVPD